MFVYTPVCLLYIVNHCMGVKRYWEQGDSDAIAYITRLS